MDEMNMNPGAATPAAPNNMKIDDRALKRMAGEAVDKVPGVLGVEGGLTDLLKSDDDMTRGVVVNVSDDNKATIGLRVITEYGRNVPTIVNDITAKVTDALRSMAGLEVQQVNVEVTDTMSREEYNRRFNANQPQGVQ